MSGPPALLDELAETFRQLEQLPANVAKTAAPLVEVALKSTAAAGTDPLGKPWAPKKGGGRAMPNAASHVATEALGTVVHTTLTGPDVFHHFGARGEPVRQVLPDPGTIPPVVEKALRAAAGKAFDKAIG